MYSLEKSNQGINFVSDRVGSSSLSSKDEPRKKISGRITLKFWQKWTKEKTIHQKTDSDLLLQNVRGFISYTYKQVQAATDHFNSNKLVHEDALHALFNGHFRIEKTEALIKRLKHQEELDVHDLFSVELRALAIIQHPNIVKGIGWCCELDHRLVIHESMPNGSLYSYLHTPNKLLPWDMRYTISLDLASAILYLHDECKFCVLHRNITSRNVLFTPDSSAKLTSFMLANFGDHGAGLEKVALLEIPEQIKPECIRAGIVTKAFDVHSFGIVLLEIATGLYPSDILERLCNLYDRHNIKEDERLNGEFDKWQMERLIVAGLCCALPNSQPRPSIKEVFQYLKTGYPELSITPKSATCFPPMTLSTTKKMVLRSKEGHANSSHSQLQESTSVDNPNGDRTGTHTITKEGRERKEVVSEYPPRSEFMIEQLIVDLESVLGQTFDIGIPPNYHSTGPLKNSHQQMMKGFAATLHEKLESGVQFEEILKIIKDFTSALVMLHVPLEEWNLFAQYVLQETKKIEYLKVRYREEVQQQTQRTLSFLQMEIEGYHSRIDEDKLALQKYAVLMSKLVDVQQELMELQGKINDIESACRSLKDDIKHIQLRTTENIEKSEYLKAEFVIWTKLLSTISSFSFGS